MALEEIEFAGKNYASSPLTDDEAGDVERTLHLLFTEWNDRLEPKFLLDQKEVDAAYVATQIAKAYYGKKFSPAPLPGTFSFRRPLVEDVCLGDTEWGQNGGVLPALAAWTAGQQSWMGGGANPNATTFLAEVPIVLRNANGSQRWSFLWFGVRSFSGAPVIKEVLMEKDAGRKATQNVEPQLRGGAARIAKFSSPMYIGIDEPFKSGVTVRSTGVDEISPDIGLIFLDGTRATDLTPDRPVAA